MRLNVGVVFGGMSVEHEVSIISALQMIENMNKLNYNPITIYLSKNNDFYYHPDMTNIDYFKDSDLVIKDAKKILFNKRGNKLELMELKNSRIRKLFDLDVIFLIVHGTNCEDGTLSAYFELLDIPYVGSNIISSALNQNKWKMKQILSFNEIPVLPFYGFYENDYFRNEEKVIDECIKIGFPLIVKPASLGSSVGISKCLDKSSLKQAINTALQYDVEILAEKSIENLMELNISVLGDFNNQQASIVEKVIQTEEILSYEDKYLRGDKQNTKGIINTDRELPAKIDDSLQQRIENLAISSFKIMGGSGVSRVDFLYDCDEEKIYVNEINTIPGSLSFYLWKDCGIDYKALIEKLINLALVKYRMRNSKIFSYKTNILSLKDNFTKGKLMQTIDKS